MSDLVLFKICFSIALIAWAQDYIDARIVKDEVKGCWLWCCGGDGRYGHAYAFGARIKAHVLSFLAHGGYLRRHEIVSHTVCDVGGCCNPAHLAPMSQAQNIKEAHTKGRAHRFPKKVVEACDD